MKRYSDVKHRKWQRRYYLSAPQKQLPGSDVLLETGDTMLLETGDKVLLED